MLESSQTKGLPCLQREIVHEVAPIYINPVGHLSPWTQIIKLQSELRHILYFCFYKGLQGDPLVREVTCL